MQYPSRPTSLKNCVAVMLITQAFRVLTIRRYLCCRKSPSALSALLPELYSLRRAPSTGFDLTPMSHFDQHHFNDRHHNIGRHFAFCSKSIWSFLFRISGDPD